MNFAVLAVRTFESLVAAGALALVIVLSGCASGSGSVESKESASVSSDSRRCKTSENLLVDTDFTRQGEFARAWRTAQHTGEPSFSVEVTDGILEINRIATQPWMLFRQTIKDARLAGAVIRYTADLQGDLTPTPNLTLGDDFAGLYLKVGRGDAKLAQHNPNTNQWGWQSFSYEEQIPQGVKRLRAGFVYQSGGALRARNPSLVILDCE